MKLGNLLGIFHCLWIIVRILGREIPGYIEENELHFRKVVEPELYLYFGDCS